MAANPVRIPISAEDQFSRVFGKASKGLSSIGSVAAQTSIKVAKIGIAFATVGTAATAALTKMSMESIDNLAKTADKIGATTEALSGLRHAAEITGVSTSTLDMAMQRLVRRVAEAANGTGEAKGALIELGLNAQKLQKLPLDQQMEKIAEAMGGVESQSDRVRLAMKLFDSEGVALVNTLGLGADGLRQMAEESQKLGLAVSRVDAAQIEMANDEVTRAKAVFTGLGNQLATAFSPIIYGIANGFRQSALDSEDFGTIGQRVANAVVNSFADVLNAINSIRTAFITVKALGLEVLLFYKEIQNTVASFFDRSNVNELNKQIQAIELQMHKTGGNAIEARRKIDELTEAYRNGTLVAEKNEFAESFEETKAALQATQVELANLLTNPPPGDALLTRFEEIQASVRRTAEQIAGVTGGMEDEEDKKGKKVAEKMSFFQEQAIKGKKKYDEFMMKSTTAQTAHVLDELGSQFAGVASNNKKLFQLNKAFQIAQAIMQTYQGATLALSSYPPPLSFVMAGAQVAAGLAQVAQIKAQSFEGGGFTGFGARAGGMDGKGGFPAMLHPNETVVDHTKGGQGITIINNVDARGAGPEVDIKIQQAMQVTSQQTIATVQDLMRRRRFA